MCAGVSPSYRVHPAGALSLAANCSAPNQHHSCTFNLQLGVQPRLALPGTPGSAQVVRRQPHPDTTPAPAHLDCNTSRVRVLGSGAAHQRPGPPIRTLGVPAMAGRQDDAACTFLAIQAALHSCPGSRNGDEGRRLPADRGGGANDIRQRHPWRPPAARTPVNFCPGRQTTPRSHLSEAVAVAGGDTVWCIVARDGGPADCGARACQ